MVVQYVQEFRRRLNNSFGLRKAEMNAMDGNACALIWRREIAAATFDFYRPACSFYRKSNRKTERRFSIREIARYERDIKIDSFQRGEMKGSR